MEGRKVQKVGYSTLAVSLPRDWVREVGLEQGDLVLVSRERDSSLRILPSALAEYEVVPKEFVVNSDLCDEPGMLERIIVGNYVLGRDTIRIVASKRIRGSHIAEVRAVVRKLMGMGIMEESPKQIVLECSVDPARFPIHTAFQRLYIVASTMHEEAMQALVQGDFELAKDAVSREEEADMIFWLIIRLLLSSQQDKSVANKVGLKEPLHIVGYRTIAVHLERMADWAEKMAQNILDIQASETEIGKEVIDALSQISELAQDICHKAVECLYSGDVKVANEAINLYKRTMEPRVEHLVRDFSSLISICAHLRTIIQGIQRIGEIGCEIAEIAINRALETPSKFCAAY